VEKAAVLTVEKFKKEVRSFCCGLLKWFGVAAD